MFILYFSYEGLIELNAEKRAETIFCRGLEHFFFKLYNKLVSISYLLKYFGAFFQESIMNPFIKLTKFSWMFSRINRSLSINSCIVSFRCYYVFTGLYTCLYSSVWVKQHKQHNSINVQTFSSVVALICSSRDWLTFQPIHSEAQSKPVNLASRRARLCWLAHLTNQTDHRATCSKRTIWLQQTE